MYLQQFLFVTKIFYLFVYYNIRECWAEQISQFLNLASSLAEIFLHIESQYQTTNSCFKGLAYILQSISDAFSM